MFKDPRENQKLFKVIKEGEIFNPKKKQCWSQVEDSLLLNLIDTETQKGNKIKWLDIALNFNKDYKQCYSRFRQINPKLKRGYWSTVLKIIQSKIHIISTFIKILTLFHTYFLHLNFNIIDIF